MQALLAGAGWGSSLTRLQAAELIAPRAAWKRIGSAARAGRDGEALRDLAELTGRIIRSGSGDLPSWAIADPGSTGSRYWDTVAATALAFAVERVGAPVPRWAREVPPLDCETVLGLRDASAENREFLRAQTPPVFREKNILSREKDWVTA